MQNISSDLMGEYDSDKASREEEKTYSQGLDLLVLNTQREGTFSRCK